MKDLLSFGLAKAASLVGPSVCVRKSVCVCVCTCIGG